MREMNDSNILDRPDIHEEIQRKSEEIGFSMPSDLHVGSLLKTLISSKPGAHILELGTGIGLSLCWMIDGMDKDAVLTTVDNDSTLIHIARTYFGNDERVEIICKDGADWIDKYNGLGFDLIFADAWPGKYSGIERILDLVKVGGFYIIDDMCAQPNWPDGHQKKVDGLIDYLAGRKDFSITKMNWSTGIIMAVRRF